MNTQAKEKISASLKRYFKTEQGFAHRNKIKQIQRLRMASYSEYLKTKEHEKQIEH